VKKLKGKPFALLGIHIGGLNAKQLKEVMEKHQLTWRSLVDAGNAGAGPIATKWNLSATPTFSVIDHKGVIRYKWAGAPGEQVMDAALDKLLKAAEANGETEGNKAPSSIPGRAEAPSEARGKLKTAGSGADATTGVGAMPFKISITEDADRQFRSLPVRDQRILEAAIQSRLLNQPTTPTQAIKRLRPNLFADFELRVGELRVL
jgi:mRNA-degrading endonuclease RelE of RelBE toxin-antitoxin system